jgi:hypothetical protein
MPPIAHFLPTLLCFDYPIGMSRIALLRRATNTEVFPRVPFITSQIKCVLSAFVRWTLTWQKLKAARQ